MTRTATSALALVAALAIPAAAGAAAPPYSFDPAPYRADPRFSVSYEGTGTWRTDFHATPPNPGGDPDTNDAHDRSAQAWRLRFGDGLTLGAPRELTGARGRALAVGLVHHTHVDGLYPELDRQLSCTLTGDTGPRAPVAAGLAVRPLPKTGSFAFRASSPFGTLLTTMPQACPDQGDSIDRILDNYFTPGFSFAPRYGPDPWFTSRAVSVPGRVLRRASRIRIALRPSVRGRPPRGCAVPSPAYETCTTRGEWRGVLTLRRAG